ncbi:MAG: DMT family transporter [Marinicella sp.]|nr:DMT family transporter [Xanthomonadales bacterium]
MLRLKISQWPVLTMLLAALIISTSSVWVKLAELGPTVTGFYRMAIGGLLMLLWCLWQSRKLWYSWTYFKWLLLGAIFFAADLWLWHRSIHYIGPGLATVLGNVQVFFMTLFGYWFLKERISWKFFLGLTLTFCGLFLLVGMQWSTLSSQYQLGVVFGIATALAYTGFMLSLRHVQAQSHALSPMANLGVLSVVCGLILAVVAAFENQSFVIHNMTTLFSVIALGLFCQVVGWVLITRTMPSLPTSVVGLLLLLQPAMSMVWDVLFFQRPTGLIDILGLSFVLLGIYLATLRGKKRLSNKDSL